ncbi:MAG: CARDB domain-containing protein [Anaerotignum propionicum]|uniref:CARDB domain-containing protein n=1 Tax=Anaerotignum propionicum TaxID=28446 RepID=UPI002B20D97B|nr:CARDB domain-containing protein [Anaerotignum propionicum]MEA5056673.1 CARDB domain-containing protein [Anaerotignum propionicum]
MAVTTTKLTDGDSYYGFIDGGKERWFKVMFNSKGKANFHISTENKNANIDLYVHTGASSSSKLLGESKNGAGKDDTVYRITVASGIYYYIRVKNLSKESVGFFVRAKNYPELYGKEADLQIQDVSTNNSLIAGETATFRVEVKNKGNCTSEPYTVEGYCNGKFFDDDSRQPLDAGDTDKARIKNIVMNKAGAYKVNVKVKEGDSIVDTYSKNFTWRKSEVAETIESMPLTRLLKVDEDKLIPDILDYNNSVSTTVDLPPFGSLAYTGGASRTSPGYKGTFNFDNGKTPSLSLSGKSYTFDKKNEEKFNALCVALAHFFNSNGFSKVTITLGSIGYDLKTNTINLTGFEVQDVLELSSTRYIYTSLSYSQSIDLDKLKKQLELVALAVVGIIILVCLPELLAAGAATAELLALGATAAKLAEAFA